MFHPRGCKAELVERRALGEHVWVRFEGLDALEAIVCWVRGFELGLEFENPIHPAAFEGWLPNSPNDFYVARRGAAHILLRSGAA